MLHQQNGSLVREFAGEKLVIEPWGKDSLRVRSTMRRAFEEEDWALLRKEHSEAPAISIPGDGSASITHGRITARVDPRGQIAFLNQKGEVLLEEFMRVRLGNMAGGDGHADFFHWPMQGEYKLDPDYWPDPAAMIAELEGMGIKLMVSVWPTIDRNSSQFAEMHAKGLLVRTERGVMTTMEFLGDTVFYDPTNPKAREHVWKLVKQNYYDKGVRIFWLDEAEPEYAVYDFDHYRYHLGPNLEVGNIYPLKYAQGFYEGMAAGRQEKIVNLLRCAWAGSQRYGALVWSGDIDSSFESLRNQLAAGLNMGLAGIPWWTTDIGGFHGGVNNDPSFRECLVRWFQFATFSPVLRMHGDREPHSMPLSTTGGGKCVSGAPNELWSFGEEAYGILKKYLRLREWMRPYVRSLMSAAHTRGSPIIRPLFYDFPEDNQAWAVEDAYMFGPDVLVAPILFERQRAREVYLPAGIRWISHGSGAIFDGGQIVNETAPLDHLPVFFRENGALSREEAPFSA